MIQKKWPFIYAFIQIDNSCLKKLFVTSNPELFITHVSNDKTKPKQCTLNLLASGLYED